MNSIIQFFKPLLSLALVLIQVFNLFISGKIFEPPLVDDGYSAALSTYERDAYRAEVLSDGYYNSFWFEPVSILTNRPHGDIEFNWGYCGLLSLTYKMAMLDNAYLPKSEKVVEGLRYFRRVVNCKFDGYSHSRAIFKDAATNGVSYDDNMWLARDLIGLYELTNENQYLNLAVEIADYIIRAAFVDLDPQIFQDYGFTLDANTPLGGFYWDDKHDALHACSNGPAVQLLAALYRLTDNQLYLDKAVQSYNFLQYLVRPDGVFHDLMRFDKDSENNIISILGPDGPPYSYNSGSPITGAVELYRATGENKYLDTAKYWAASADTYFAKDSGVDGLKSYPSGNIWFNLILLNGYTALAPYDGENTTVYIGHMQNSIDYAYDHYVSKGNLLYGPFLPNDWIKGWGDQSPKDVWVLNTSSQAEIYATLALYEQSMGS
ncbi:MAG TPA: glycoside hydrolase family 76 protein [Clostridia bacterium]|nr:glycoside hydrolase family 76 protein [Clostridia bacterium]